MDRVEDRKWQGLPRKKVKGKFAQRGRIGHHHSLVSLKTGLGLQRRHRGYARLSPYTLQFPKLHWNLFPAFDWGHFFTTGKGKALLAFIIIGLAINGVYFAIDQHSPGRQALDDLTGTHGYDPTTNIWKFSGGGETVGQTPVDFGYQGNVTTQTCNTNAKCFQVSNYPLSTSFISSPNGGVGYQLGNSSIPAITGAWDVGNLFKTTQGAKAVFAAKFQLSNLGSAVGPMYGQLWTVSGSGPNAIPSTRIAVSTNSILAQSLTGVFTQQTFNFKNVSVTPNTFYFVTVSGNMTFATFPSLVSVRQTSAIYLTDNAATLTGAPPGTWGAFNTQSVAVEVDMYGQDYGVLLSKQPVGDLSVGVSKMIELDIMNQPIGSCLNGGSCGTGSTQSWGFFLRRNATLPSQLHDYKPENDPSVVLVLKEYWSTGACCAGPLAFQNDFLLQKSPSVSVATDNSGGCDGTTSCYLQMPSGNSQDLIAHNYFILNFTGSTKNTAGSSFSCPVLNINGGPNCSYLVYAQGATTGSTATATSPALAISSQVYYLGMFVTTGTPMPVNFCMNTGNCGAVFTPITNGCNSASMELDYCIADPTQQYSPAPTTDSGGFFGSALKFVVSTFIPGGSLIVSAWNTVTGAFPGIGTGINNFFGSIIGQLQGAVYAALAAIVDTLARGLSAFESISQTILNLIGSAFGFPATSTNCGVAGGTCALGDLVFLWMNNLISFLAGTFNTLLAQLGAIFTGIFNAFLVFVQWIVQAFSFLTSILLFAVNIAVFAFGIFTTALKWTTIFVPFWIFIFFLGFNADDGMAGWITWYNFLKWITFDIGVSWTLLVLNYSIDVVLFLIGLIPKPLIQMSISKIPRLPILDIHGSFAIPDFRGDALKEGNLFAILGMLGGFIGFVWYELTQTGIPGTLAAEFPTANFVTTGATAITFYKLFLPMAVLVVFLLMIPTLFTNIFGVRVVGMTGIPVSASIRGRHGVKASRAPASRVGFVKTSPSRLGRRIEKRALSARSKVDKAFREEQLRNKREEEARLKRAEEQKARERVVEEAKKASQEKQAVQLRERKQELRARNLKPAPVSPSETEA